ncbi:tyrosine-type recombinase/integrase [Streptococcus sp. zg-86]|uniref:Tyrosine-type recombinase/integrase n=1 Tax=Streptococcus zhangguiae TaxID=2664091 RepID=A0A6I4RBN2_9STRE|nr:MULTISPECIES: site-specific integrase [unclassified Streptococcus]MTB64120.1 tyrosine-type recombinase/integrase [Streptococcus sp. zg-86]MTB90554.1 tyrosine-type recombinase/integrase [Streptococcus sp. zg-36]MWV56108.1 tyrosine-type recombinase/integrase [Streptococcus sp. zg-70]QTH48267.1 site-specific integrase [Streptococcus sp. zg-86]
MKYTKTKYPNIFTYETTKGKRYYVRRGYYLQGKKKEATKSNLKTLPEARTALAEIERMIENNEFAYNKNLTVDQYWGIYSDKMIETGRWAPDTECNKFNIYNNHFKERYGSIKLKNVLRDEYELYITSLLKSLSKHTVRQMHGIFNALFNDAVTCQYLDNNPIDGIYVGDSAVTPKNKRLSLADFKTFDTSARAILDDYNYTIVRLTYFGLRRSEVVGIKFSNLNLRQDGRYDIHIDESRTRLRNGDKKMKTRSSNRMITLDIETSELLSQAVETSHKIAYKYKMILNKDDFIFRTDFSYCKNENRGKAIPWSRVGTLFRQVEQETGLHITPHMMRHFFASQGVIAGVPVAHMAAALGHSTNYMTAKYTHIQDEISSSVTDSFMRAIQ